MKTNQKKSIVISSLIVIFSLFFVFSISIAQDLASEFAKVEKVDKTTGDLLVITMQAKETNDLKLTAQTLKETSANTDQLAQIAPIAKDEGVVKLCQNVMNAAKRIDVLLAQLFEIAFNVSQTSADPATVEEAKLQMEQIKQIQDQNANTIQISLACGAVPTAEAFEPPGATNFGPNESPIQDGEPGSAI